MADVYAFPTGRTLYALVFHGSEVWNTGAPGFEAINAAHWTDYDIALAESGSTGLYLFTFPAGITDPGNYSVTVYQRAGGSPAASDSALAAGTKAWDGSAEVVIPSATQIAAATGNAPTDTSKCRITAAAEITGEPVTLKATLVSPPVLVGARYLDRRDKFVTSREDGTLTIDLPRTATYRLRCDALGIDTTGAVPDQETATLEELE